MSTIEWDKAGEHWYQTGIDKVALYLPATSGVNKYGVGNAWDGVTALNESPSGAEASKIYADNINYLTLISKEEFALSLECYKTPEAFDACDGTAALDGFFQIAAGKARSFFGLAYRVLLGNDKNAVEVADNTLNCEYHLVYGCKASPSSRDHATINDTPEAETMSYEISTEPLTGSDIPSTFTEIAHVVFNFRDIVAKTDATKAASILAQLQSILWGTGDPEDDDATDGYLPTPAQLNGIAIPVEESEP